ncbi:MAG: hydrolase, partial [Alphaproteobacteria bacterium]|nr:hydrolase [Alphaproteobacteria bacterium]
MTGSEWERYLSEDDRAVIARARFGRRMGFGRRPAVVAIDCQRYMVGERGVADGRYPSSCGPIGWAAVDQVARLARGA